MKKLIPLIPLLLAVYTGLIPVSCGKTKEVFTQHWMRYNYIDTNAWAEAVFCDTIHNRHFIDTVPVLFLVANPVDKLTGSIQFASRIPYKDSLFIRHVVQYLKRID